MTITPITTLTVSVLSEIIQDWPREAPDGRLAEVFVADRFPDLSHGPMPATQIGMLENDNGLVLYPDQKDLPMASVGTEADALDLALEAINYQLLTHFLDYDPDRANQLLVRAVTAIESVKNLSRGFGV